MRKLFSILAGLALSMALLTSCEKNPETGTGVISDAGAVTGVLKDAETGKAMANKYIQLYVGSYLLTQTDAEGRFLFGHIPPQLYCFIESVFDEEENFYDVVYLAVDGEVRDLSGNNDEDDLDYLHGKGMHFSVKAGQVRNLEIRVKKEIYEEY